MASKRTLARHLFNYTKTSSRVSDLTRMQPTKPGIASDPGVRRRYLHRRAFFPPEMVPAGGNLVERLRELDLSKDRIRLEEILPAAKKEEEFFPAVTVEDARKLMRVAEMEMVRSRLRETGKKWVPYTEFVRVCGEACSDPEQATRVANMLDESGSVIALGKLVCLKPEEITRMVEGLIPTEECSSREVTRRREELEKLEAVKAEIDKRADAMVRRELWAGLGLLMAQTIGFIRLTFWELSWDVMEPICFYVSSSYFMAGYAFFLNTSKEPCFEGFYKSRFDKKQKSLFQIRNFDIHRYNELLKMFRPLSCRPDRFCS